MSEQGVELKGYAHKTNNPPPPWGAGVVGDMNPTYQGINDNGNQTKNSGTVPNPTDPTTSDRVYDSVPGQGKAHHAPDPQQQPQPPPPNPGRRITTNALYEPTGSTLHPQTMTSQASYISADVEEAEYWSSSGCVRVWILSILVGISLFLAMVAVVLVLLLWFGVYDPTECPTTTTTTNTGANTGGGGDCTCPEPNLQPLMDWINEETANLTAQIEKLTAELEFYSNQNANFTSQTNTLGAEITSVNSSCLNTLDAVSDQLGSIEGLNFNAQLLNVGVFNSCIYEYLDECQILQNDNNCSTEYSKAIVSGYSNLELACHVGLTQIIDGGVFFAPITNLRFNTTGVDTDTASAQEILENSTVRCECSVVGISLSATRNEIFHCKIFRVRCLTTETYKTTIVT